MTRIVLSVLMGFYLTTAAWADDRPAVEAAAFSTLDLNEDGVLSGREVRSDRDYDTDADGEVSRAEFLAGRRRATGTPTQDADPQKQFTSKDLNEDEVLSGKEAQGWEHDDTNRDGEITLSEFLTGRAKDNTPASPPAVPNSGTPVASVADDPRVQAWNDQLTQQLDQGERWAIVVGVDKYTQFPLNCCVADARLLADTLVKQCGLARDHVLVITDDQDNLLLRPNKINLQALIPALLRRVSAKDTILITFSGHGMLTEG